MRPKNKTISAQDTHAQVSREKLLDAAISLVNESGMSSLTIRNICDKAGISTGSFYNLFEGKDDLVSYYLRDVFIAYKQKAEEEASGRTALEKIILIYRFYIDCILETGLEFVTGLYSAMTNPVFNFLERDADEEVVLDRCRQYLEEGIEAGEVKADINMNESPHAYRDHHHGQHLLLVRFRRPSRSCLPSRFDAAKLSVHPLYRSQLHLRRPYHPPRYKRPHLR